MAHDVDLKDLEKKMFRSMSEDGLIEMLVGMLLLTTAMSNCMREVGYSAMTVRLVAYPLMFLGVILVFIGKRYVTIPRLGMVRFSPGRQKKRMKVVLALTASIVFMNIMTVVVISQGGGGGVSGELLSAMLASALVATVIMIIFGLIAHVYEYPRLVVVGVLFGSAELTYTYVSHTTDIGYAGLAIFGIAGGAVLAMGAAALDRFVKRYPLPGARRAPDGA
jgi:hypothetical protein